MSQKRRPRRSPRGRTPVWLIRVLGIAAVLLIGVLVMLLTRPDDDPAEQDGAPDQDRAEPERLAIVGDSNTEMNSPDFAAGQIGDTSWASTVLSAGHRFTGGWAVSGSTSVDQAEGLEEVEDADVLLVMTGTNDLARGISFEDTAESLDEIVAKAPAERVVLLAIPPRDQETTPSSTEFNLMLQGLAGDRGWEFFDALEFLRSPDGGFVAGMTEDGLHLSPEAQELFGETVVDYLADDDAAASSTG